MNARARFTFRAVCWPEAARLCLSLFLLVVTGCEGPRTPAVSPGIYDARLSGGQKREFRVEVDLVNPAPSREPLDVLFLFDATASMGNIIDAVRDGALDIMIGVQALSSDTRFGVASFADYQDAPDPYFLHQDMSSEPAVVQAALSRVMLHDGKDFPEAYSRGLHESTFLNWRPDARRFIVLFGDAPAHDPDFYGEDLGVDPGRDRLVGTADDLRLVGVVQQLKDAGIVILAVHDRARMFKKKPYQDATIRGFEYMARVTGGTTRPVGSASEVGEAIKGGLREQYLSRPYLAPTSDFTGWVDIGEPLRSPGRATQFVFPVVLHPPRGTKGGVYRFPLTATTLEGSSGDSLGVCLVHCRVGILYWPWRWILLPLLFLSLPVLLFRRAGMGGLPPLLESMGALKGLGWRLGLVLLWVCLIVLLIRWDPGAPPKTGGSTRPGHSRGSQPAGPGS